MTLVLAVSTPVYSLQVGDRLVSKAGQPHDTLADKSVVFRATDGLLALGYTGPALLERAPTDTWIADSLSGGSCAGEVGAVRYGAFSVRDTGSTLRALCQRLRASRQFPTFGGEVSAVGWQWKNSKRTRALVRNVLWSLHSGSGELRWEQFVPRQAPERKTTFRMAWIGDWPLGEEDWRRLLERVGAAGPDWEAVQALLVGAIRQASAQRPGTIGSHCMSVLLRPWLYPNALVQFIPSFAHRQTALGQAVEVAYSPWMVAPDAIHAPAVLVGGMNCEQGLLTYSMEAPPVRRIRRSREPSTPRREPDARAKAGGSGI